VTDVPTEETSDEHCEVKRLAERFGEIRETLYGKIWNVRSYVGSKNIAFTDLHLGLHMDIALAILHSLPLHRAE